MKVAYNLQHQIVDIDDASKDIIYTCIHCGCEMIPSALNSHKVSPYFRAKNSHDDECSAKLVDTKTRYNNQDSNIETVYEKLINSSFLEKSNEIVDSENNPERNRRKRSNIRIHYLNQLVSFCVGNDINEFIGDKQIKDFFIDARTYKDFEEFQENELYLVGVRYKSYSTPHNTMYFMCPIGVREVEIGVWFQDKSTFFNIKNLIFNKDEDDNYKDIYILALGTSTGKLKIFNENQFYFVPMNQRIKGED